MISVWKCLKKPPLLKRIDFGSHSFTTNRGLNSLSNNVVTYCNTDTPTTRIQFYFKSDSKYSGSVHWTVTYMDRMSLRRSVTFMRRVGMVAGCIFILLNSHVASWKRLKKAAVKMTTNLITIFTSTFHYTACISYRPSTYKMRAMFA